VVAVVYLESHELLASRGRMHRGEATRGVVVVVERRCDAVLSGKIGDLLGLEDAAAFRHVRVNDGYRSLLEEILESSGEVDVLARAYRLVAGVLDPNEVIGVLPRYGILHPSQLVFLRNLAALDEGLDVEVAYVVTGEGDIIPHLLANRGAKISDVLQTLLGDLTAVEIGAPITSHPHSAHPHASRTTPAALTASASLTSPTSLTFHPLTTPTAPTGRSLSGGRRSRRPDHVLRAGDGPKVQVHFEELEPAGRRRLGDALEEVIGHFIGLYRRRCVGIEENPVAELAPQHLPDRNPPGFARQVPTGHLHCRDAAARDPISPVLLDPGQDGGDIAGVHSHD